MENGSLVQTVRKKLSEFRRSRQSRPSPVTTTEDEFAADVIAGLTAFPKFLPSKYLYDRNGDALFQKITTLPEYYLTRCEESILKTYKEKVWSLVSGLGQSFRLIELGPGDGQKTSILLSHFIRHKSTFSYYPIDISQNVLNILCNRLGSDFPRLKIEPLAADYMAALDELSTRTHVPALILFMGGNIGNFSKPDAASFLSLISQRMRQGDVLLCGFDLKKDPAVIYHAYNDKQGVTRSFNFNLLRRINRELDADFNADDFMHYPTYDPQTGEMKSYLISERAQTVTIGQTGHEIVFDAWEPVFMEVSNKYSAKEITDMCSDAGLHAETLLYDKKKYYVVALLTKK